MSTAYILIIMYTVHGQPQQAATEYPNYEFCVSAKAELKESGVPEEKMKCIPAEAQ